MLSVVVLLVGFATAVVCVGIQLSVLRWLTGLVPQVERHPYLGVGGVVVVAIFTHLVEMIVFTSVLAALTADPAFGQIAGSQTLDFRERMYFVALTFTSLGYGDLTPTGHLRLFAGIVALTGLVMITWTASFTFLVMQRLWGGRLQ